MKYTDKITVFEVKVVKCLKFFTESFSRKRIKREKSRYLFPPPHVINEFTSLPPSLPLSLSAAAGVVIAAAAAFVAFISFLISFQRNSEVSLNLHSGISQWTTHTAFEATKF